jgi:hypothetical protein
MSDTENTKTAPKEKKPTLSVTYMKHNSLIFNALKEALDVENPELIHRVMTYMHAFAPVEEQIDFFNNLCSNENWKVLQKEYKAYVKENLKASKAEAMKEAKAAKAEATAEAKAAKAAKAASKATEDNSAQQEAAPAPSTTVVVEEAAPEANAESSTEEKAAKKKKGGKKKKSEETASMEASA